MAEQTQTHYRVLARKYRPRHFGELVGQDALVRTLRNAIESGRIAHAYMLTGIRGTGKTTTARIIARALNYTGPDGTAGPTTGPTDDCAICRAIAEDRHPDVLEMDAASRTGVDDIREITDGVRYAPAAARYKIYIIDEVHMLSRQAFNALLKTLEEPPPHVIFIFATTEIRKVPVTVLSRCQRFDLRRVDAATLAGYYATICEKEGARAEPAALELIGRAADGSVRDGLSLLDQAIALGGADVTVAQVQDMLGLADRARIMDLLEHGLKGECAEALSILSDLYRGGTDPVVVVQDLLDYTHVLTRLRAVPELKDGQALSPDAQARAAELAGQFTMPTLGRAWQILLKGLGEVGAAPNPQAAAEMLLIRLSYAADLPDPADLLRRLKNSEAGPSAQGGGHSGAAPGAGQRVPETAGLSAGAPAMGGGGAGNVVALSPAAAHGMAAHGMAAAATARAADDDGARPLSFATLPDIDESLRARGHMILASELYQYVHLVRLEKNRLEFRPAAEARPALAAALGKALQEISGERWVVSVSGQPGAPTLAEQKLAADNRLYEEVRAHPLVQQVFDTFPGVEMTVDQDE